MILRQFRHSDPVAISCLFACGEHAACAVVDPVGDIAPYPQAADNIGMRIRFFVDTDIHADYRAAARPLAAAAGAEYVLHAAAETVPIHRVEDGDRMPLGNAVVDARRHYAASKIDTAAAFVALMSQEVQSPPADAAALRVWSSGLGAA